jgi:hypothetical protein
MGTAAVTGWLAGHLAWFTVALLAVWTPPVLFAIAVDVGWVTGPWTEYPALTDPALILSVVQLALMAASLAGLPSRRPWAWWLLAGALAAWGLHAAWALQGRLRLMGVSTLWAPDAVMMLGGIAVSAAFMVVVRPRFLAPGSPPRVP